jgi:acetyl-CoA acyltransferase
MCVGIGMGGAVIWENPHWSADADGRGDLDAEQESA